MEQIGVMPMPADFKYLDVYRHGRPQHDRFDDFSIRHPKMDVGARAKLFAPFDALRGFNFAISRKEILYIPKPELSREALRELNRRLDILRVLAGSSRAVRAHPVRICVTYYVPCADRHSEAYETQGQLHTAEGICTGVAPEVRRTLGIDRRQIPFADLIRLESPDGIFQR